MLRSYPARHAIVAVLMLFALLIPPSASSQQGTGQGPRATPPPAPTSSQQGTGQGPGATPPPAPTLGPKVDLPAEIVGSSVPKAVPANDDFGSARVISGDSFTDVVVTSEATVAPDDPPMGCGAALNSNTVWYRYTASAPGRLRISTAGSSYDTVIAVYTGARGSLTRLTCADDTESSFQAELSLRVDSGVPYDVLIADFGAPGGGNLRLSAGFLEAIPEPLDIVLLQDESGSMSDDISALRALAPQIWDAVAEMSGAGFRMSVAGFRDYARGDWSAPSDWVYRERGSFTESRATLVSSLNTLSAAGGGDEPEAQYAALAYLLTGNDCIDSNGDGDCADTFDTPAGRQPQFRSGARKVILLATDAPFHSPLTTPGYPGPDDATVRSLLIANRAVLIGLVPGGAGVIPELDSLAAATGGSTQTTGGGGQLVADAVAAAIGELLPVSPELSTVAAVPSSAPANGETEISIVVALRDTEGNPVPGRQVLLFSERGAADAIR